MPRMSLEEALSLAQGHLDAGRLAEAGQVLQAVLQAAPDSHPAYYLLGLVAFFAGDVPAAEQCFRRAVALEAGFGEYHNCLAGILNILGRAAEAELEARTAIALDPALAQAYGNLGVARQTQGHLPEAVDLFGRAIELAPGYFEARINRANAIQKMGRFEEAIECNREALALHPDFSPAYLNIGAAYQALGRFDEAIVAYQQMLRINPRDVSALNNLGTSLERQKKIAEAEAAYRQALAIDPNAASIHYNLGNLFRDTGRPEEAVSCYERALAAQPKYFEAYNNLGNALQALGRMAEAETAFRRALELQPDSGSGRENLANALQMLGRLDEAEGIYRNLLARNDRAATIHGNLASALKGQGRVDEARAEYQLAADLAPECDTQHSNLMLSSQYCPDVSAADLAAAHAQWQQRHEAPRIAAQRPHANLRDPDRPLRIGFVSADLWSHTVGLLVLPLLENLDRKQHHVVCYYDNVRKDSNQERMRRAADLWREVMGMPEEDLADLIRADRIDILFDLAGHTAKNRLVVFARKPAPVQISWAGYVGTTGLKSIDYVLADRHEAPEGAEQFYSEGILRMPDGYICYGPPDDAPEVGPLPARANGHLTFGSFNNPAKTHEQVVALWSRILHRVPSATLYMKYTGLDSSTVQSRYRQWFAEQGIDPSRLAFSGQSPHAEMMAAYNQVDLCLDTFPYAGGITTCEAIWMGVPVVTCPGSTFASRHSLTHLTNAGLGQFVARDLDHYLELAVDWAGQLDRLAELRASMRSQVRASPLCDANRFARNFERLLREAWRRWVAIRE